MKKTKKLVALLLAACMLLACMAGCSGGNQQDNSTPNSNPSTGTNDPAAPATDGNSSGETVNLDWFLSTSRVPATWDLNQYVMKTITEKTGVTISANIPAQDADTKLNLMIVDGKLPDLITISNDTLIKDMVDAGLVWDMGELLSTYVPDSPLVNGGYPEDVKNALIDRDGGWYAFPSHIRSADGRAIWGLNPATEDM